MFRRIIIVRLGDRVAEQQPKCMQYYKSFVLTSDSPLRRDEFESTHGRTRSQGAHYYYLVK